MPFHAENPYFAQRMKEANRLMTFTMRRGPQEYYDFIERPSLFNLVQVAGDTTAAEFSRTYDSESGAVDLLRAGIQDIIPPLISVVKHGPEFSKEQASALMMHEETIATYGILASMPQGALTDLYEDPDSHFALSDDSRAVVLTEAVRTSPNFGCEAVDVRSGYPEMSPIFKKFVPWAGQLAVLAYYEKRH